MEEKIILDSPPAPAETSPAPAVPEVQEKGGKIIWATGRRKTAIAQVKMVSSKNGGKVLINEKTVTDYFKKNEKQVLTAMQSLNAVKSFGGYNFFINVQGGGITGQADAIRHGMARALAKVNEKIRLQMRKEGFLTRDPRAVERKKSGQPKARKRFQYSKR